MMSQGFSSPVVISFFASVAVLLSATTGWASQLASHRATYDLELRKTTSGSDINAIEGRTIYSIERLCDGWQSVEDYAITFSFDEIASNFISHYETWESLSGNAFSFSVVENSTVNGPAEYNGFANLLEGEGEAYFLDGEDAARPLPAGTQFPVNHLRQLLTMADAGEMFHSGPMFIGGERGDALYFVSAIMGKQKPGAGDAILGSLATDSFRHLHLAYYKPDAVEPEPEYEIEFELQQNGVIRQYLVDYGDFSMRAKLTDITALEEPAC